MNILDKAYGLLDGITRGTWTTRARGHHVYVPAAECDPPMNETAETGRDAHEYYGGRLIAESIEEHDARFIAAAPQLVRDLCAEIERLRGTK